MKRILFITSIIINLIIGYVYPAEYILSGLVYNYDNTSGTAATPNSFASLNAYREGIPGQIGHQNNGENSSYPHKIYASDGANPAYFITDVGSSDWVLTPAQAGQIVISVIETGEPENGWTGDSYIACTITVITDSDIINSATQIPPVKLELLPEPLIIYEGTNSITVGWTGLNNDLITGYTLYRSDDGGNNYTSITITGQIKGGQIFYIDNDSDLNAGITYYYKIAANILWGGGSGAPDYYETFVKSKASSGAQIHPPTSTPTYTATYTETHTLTATYTETATLTVTETYTFTITYTETATEIKTFTFTKTETKTNTLTATYTFTITPTNIITVMPNVTNTPVFLSDTLISNIKNHKIIVLNNPLNKNKLKIGLYSDINGIAQLYIYNIKAEFVQKILFSVSEGINIIEKDIKDISPGIYVLATKINDKSMPIRKIVMIR